MKWADLGELILKMTPKEMNEEVVVVVNDKPYSDSRTNLLINKNEFDCHGLTDGQPYLEVVGEELDMILPEEENGPQ